MNDTIVTVRFTDLGAARRALRMLKVALVIAEVEDPDPDVLDSALDALGGAAGRRDAAAFYTELRAA